MFAPDNDETFAPTCGQCSWNQELTRGMSTARRMFPERLLNGCGAHSSAMPCDVLSVYSGVSSRKGATSEYK